MSLKNIIDTNIKSFNPIRKYKISERNKNKFKTRFKTTILSEENIVTPNLNKITSIEIIKPEMIKIPDYNLIDTESSQLPYDIITSLIFNSTVGGFTTLIVSDLFKRNSDLKLSKSLSWGYGGSSTGVGDLVSASVTIGLALWYFLSGDLTVDNFLGIYSVSSVFDYNYLGSISSDIKIYNRITTINNNFIDILNNINIYLFYKSQIIHNNNLDYNIISYKLTPSCNTNQLLNRNFLKNYLINDSLFSNILFGADGDLEWLLNEWKNLSWLNFDTIVAIYNALIIYISILTQWYQERSLIDYYNGKPVNPWFSTSIGNVFKIGKQQSRGTLLGDGQYYIGHIINIYNCIMLNFFNLAITAPSRIQEFFPSIVIPKITNSADSRYMLVVNFEVITLNNAYNTLKNYLILFGYNITNTQKLIFNYKNMNPDYKSTDFNLIGMERYNLPKNEFFSGDRCPFFKPDEIEINISENYDILGGYPFGYILNQSYKEMVMYLKNNIISGNITKIVNSFYKSDYKVIIPKTTPIFTLNTKKYYNLDNIINISNNLIPEKNLSYINTTSNTPKYACLTSYTYIYTTLPNRYMYIDNNLHRTFAAGGSPIYHDSYVNNYDTFIPYDVNIVWAITNIIYSTTILNVNNLKGNWKLVNLMGNESLGTTLPSVHKQAKYTGPNLGFYLYVKYETVRSNSDTPVLVAVNGNLTGTDISKKMITTKDRLQTFVYVPMNQINPSAGRRFFISYLTYTPINYSTSYSVSYKEINNSEVHIPLTYYTKTNDNNFTLSYGYNSIIPDTFSINPTFYNNSNNNYKIGYSVNESSQNLLIK